MERDRLTTIERVKAEEDERVFRVLDLAASGHHCDLAGADFVCKRCGRRFDMATPITRDDICPHAAVEWTMNE